MINQVEEKAGGKIINRNVGGNCGGGSTLSERGKDLLNHYMKIREILEKEADALYRKYFEGDSEEKK